MNPEGTAANGLRWRAVAVLAPLIIAAYHWRAALPGMAFAGSDLRFFFYAVREAVAGALLQGHLPGWQRGIFVGYPLVADPQAAVFDFATWLTLPWNAPRALTLATLAHLTVAAWGMLLWARLRGLSATEGLLAAVLFALGAKQTVHVIHWNFAASTAWWPWMLAGLEGFATSGRGRWLLLASLATAASWFGGSPQMAYFGTLVAGLYALVLAPVLWRRSRTDAILALASVPLGLVIAAPLVLPVSELASLGPRGAGLSYVFATSWKWIDRWALALFLLPKAYGGRHAWSAEMNLWEATGYLGILPLGLAAAAPFLRRRGLWLFALLALLGVWVSFGEDAWLALHRLLFELLPGYASFRCPTRLLMVTSFASALLAAEGLHALRSPEGYGARAARAGAVLILAGALALLLPRLPGFDLAVGVAKRTAWIALGLAALGLAWLAVGARRGRGTAWALAACALFLGDVYLAFGTMNEVAPAAGEKAPLSEFAPLVPGAGQRVGVVAGWGQTANATLRQGWEGVTGYGPMSVQRVRSLIEATQDDRVRPSGPTRGDTNFPRPRPSSSLWRFFAAPLVISDEPLPLARLATGAREWRGPLVAYRAEALPRVYWVGSWTVADDARAVGPMLEAARGHRAVLAEAPPGIPPGAPPTGEGKLGADGGGGGLRSPTGEGNAGADGGGRALSPPTGEGNAGADEGPVAAEAVRVGPSWLEASVTAPRPGLLVVLDPFYPGWSATLDGRPARLLRANFAFEAIPVGEGRHALRLEYRSRLLPLGFGAAAGTLLLLAAALALRHRGVARGASRMR